MPSSIIEPAILSQNNPKTKSPNATTKPALKLVAELVGAMAGASNSTGEGAGEMAVYLCLGVKTTTINFCPCSQCPFAPLMK
ncbi:hypothetical protein SLEP1_g41210 [Rubroshorea leprosula]|uniref:Uncharacterized protein n=1 Tax=Rubroshorea leprosula TaxID=152421 RepID=A0AAV5L5Y5_9ROSI|nr:hypothetical protein SLEP1_g41210 [Rubroshorea leprosula]